MAQGDEIVAWKKEVAEQIPYERDDCPICGWSLDKHPVTGILNLPLAHWRSR